MSRARGLRRRRSPFALRRSQRHAQSEGPARLRVPWRAPSRRTQLGTLAGGRRKASFRPSLRRTQQALSRKRNGLLPEMPLRPRGPKRSARRRSTRWHRPQRGRCGRLGPAGSALLQPSGAKSKGRAWGKVKGRFASPKAKQRGFAFGEVKRLRSKGSDGWAYFSEICRQPFF